jgi:hypothetical protein
MKKITCPKCKDQILLVPDLTAMSKTFSDHVELHEERLINQGIPKNQINRIKKEVEDSLIGEAIKTTSKK